MPTFAIPDSDLLREAAEQLRRKPDRYGETLRRHYKEAHDFCQWSNIEISRIAACEKELRDWLLARARERLFRPPAYYTNDETRKRMTLRQNEVNMNCEADE